MIKKIIKILIGIVGVLIFASAIICVLYLIDRNKRLSKLESNSQLAETSVGTIEYKIYGNKGPVILLMHGTPGGYDQGGPIEGYRVLSVSRPGYLRTPLQAGKTPAEQAQAFSALLESLKIEKVCVWGASGGGPSAISFAALFPEKTSALFLLMAVSQSWEPYEEKPSYMRSDFLTWAIGSLMQIDSVLKAALKVLIPNPNTRQLILEDHEKIEKLKGLLWTTWPPSKRYLGELNDINQFKSLALPASKIKIPTLIIHGSEDINAPVSQSKKLAEQIPGSKLVILEGVDHIGFFSKMEEIEKIFTEFLEGVSANHQYSKNAHKGMFLCSIINSKYPSGRPTNEIGSPTATNQ
jgi:pimeloyl-ACP methyl ester carboxylesterase